MFRDCYRKRRVLVTGHTGFKGSHLACWLRELGAEVLGAALPPEAGSPSHWEIVKPGINSLFFDIRDREKLCGIFRKFRPEIVFHLAAQALVRPGYLDPVSTFDVNALGTVNVLEACRRVKSVRAAVVVTSDKCYENRETRRRFRETDPVGGRDPYSASKGCAEIICSCYKQSFFDPEKYGEHGMLLATARAGNVVGGGDWARDRLIPDLARAAAQGKCAVLRNPGAIRPWQHVWEPLSGYLALGERLLAGETAFSGAWNFGPLSTRGVTVLEAAQIMAERWPKVRFECAPQVDAPYEAHTLRLDCSKAKRELGWHGVWSARQAFRRTADWYRSYYETGKAITAEQLEEYIAAAGKANLAWTK